MLNCFSSTFEVNSAVPAAVAGSRAPLTAIIKPAETVWINTFVANLTFILSKLLGDIRRLVNFGQHRMGFLVSIWYNASISCHDATFSLNKNCT